MHPTRKATARPLRQVLFEIVLLFLSFSVSLNVRRLFDREVKVPFEIETTSKVGAESNYAAIIAIIVTTLLLFWVLRWLAVNKKVLFRVVVTALLSISLLLGVFAPGVARFQNNADSFHNGEQLAPSLAFSRGEKPYKDLYVLRGAGEDIVAPWLSFKLFGESIGSYYFMTAATQLVSAVLFFALIAVLLKGKLEFLVASIWFTLSSYGDFFYARDIFVWTSLILLLVLLRSRFKASYKLAGLGLLASVSLFHSFDRGVFLALLLALTVLTLFFFEKRNEVFARRRNKLTSRLSVLVWAGGGYALGLLGGLAFLGPSGFSSFLSTTFGESAKYQGIIFNTPYSILGPLTVVDWLPILTIIALVVVVFRNVRAEWPKLSEAVAIQVLLLAFSIVFFRSATGRPDSGHIAYGTPILFLTLFYVGFASLKRAANDLAKKDFSHARLAAPVFVILFLLSSTTFTNYYRLAQMNQAPLESTKIFLSAPKKPDVYWETEQEQIITAFLKNASNKNDYFFDFSSDPLFYFTTKLRNPTRFSISWFADPAPLEKQMLDELKANPPQIVLYESGTYYDSPDFISMKARLPKVNEWLLQNYTQPETIEGTQAKVIYKR